MAVPGAEIILLGEDNLRRISLEETEAFETMKLFIENREKIIAKFSSEEEESELS
jgi:predicted ATPase